MGGVTMARKYESTICKDGSCRSLGTARDVERAKRRVMREMRKLQKAMRKQKVPHGKLYGEVRGVERGVPDPKPTWEADEHYGSPDEVHPELTKRGRKKLGLDQ